jgi:hypothetical protein
MPEQSRHDLLCRAALGNRRQELSGIGAEGGPGLQGLFHQLDPKQGAQRVLVYATAVQVDNVHGAPCLAVTPKVRHSRKPLGGLLEPPKRLAEATPPRRAVKYSPLTGAWPTSNFGAFPQPGDGMARNLTQITMS